MAMYMIWNTKTALPCCSLHGSVYTVIKAYSLHIHWQKITENFTNFFSLKMHSSASIYKVLFYNDKCIVFLKICTFRCIHGHNLVPDWNREDPMIPLKKEHFKVDRYSWNMDHCAGLCAYSLKVSDWANIRQLDTYTCLLSHIKKWVDFGQNWGFYWTLNIWYICSQ